MGSATVQPRLLFADEQGQIYDHPELLMLCRRGEEFGPPKPGEFMPLPEESDVFLLPGPRAMGLDPDSGQVEVLEETAVAAFVCPGHTATGIAAYRTDSDGAPTLPLFSYAAVGFANGKFWVAAKRVDQDQRQVFRNVRAGLIENGARRLQSRFPRNRLVKHLAGCALKHGCPAARNFCLGRFEAPLPTAQACNARCVGCLSLQSDDSGFCAVQPRIGFRPEAEEIVEAMLVHAEREPRPIFSFGQGCEGEPLTEATLLAEAVRRFRAQGGPGTVNVNTNASLPGVIPELAQAGFDSIRVSCNSASPGLHHAYHRPQGYSLDDVKATIAAAKEHGLFVSLNLLFFPGVTDSESEFAALEELVNGLKVDFIQLRNLNLDPELYLKLAKPHAKGPSIGLLNFRKRLRKTCPWLGFGYFNPYRGENPNETPGT